MRGTLVSGYHGTKYKMKYLLVIFLWDYQLANSHAVVSLYAPLEFFKLYLCFCDEFQKFSSSITKHLFAGYLYSISASTVSPRWEKVLSLLLSSCMFMFIHSNDTPETVEALKIKISK